MVKPVRPAAIAKKPHTACRKDMSTPEHLEPMVGGAEVIVAAVPNASTGRFVINTNRSDGGGLDGAGRAGRVRRTVRGGPSDGTNGLPHFVQKMAETRHDVPHVAQISRFLAPHCVQNAPPPDGAPQAMHGDSSSDHMTPVLHANICRSASSA